MATAQEPKPKPARPPAPASSPVSPEDSLKYFQLDPACRIELAAAEPQVVDPVAVRFDEDGRMWVVEMGDYPHGPAKGEPGKSQIKVLEDRDGDGRYETATVFADKLTFVTGVQPWKGGVFVTLAGRVAYMKDTNGDGRADVDETWFTGFAQENSQLRANHPRLALDNHIYVANGLRGGKVVNVRKKETKPIDISGMDFRFNPLTGDCEAVSGHSQFGLTFDDYGNRFFCTNRNPLVHVVLEQRYLKQNPAVAVPSVVQDVAPSGEQSRLFPLTRNWTTSNLHAGQFTAACGVEIYRGDALPKEFYGNAFTCDPTANLVHREIISPHGATFKSRPAYPDREFLASTDEWFRPVNLTLGSDGALYVVDMYRAVIEHPEFVPDELKKRPDLMLGNDRGRIYRVVAKDQASGRRQPADQERHQLSKAKSEELVKLLEHPNAWWRETAQRLLLERQDKSVQALVREQVTDKHRVAFGRITAIWFLQSLAELPFDTLRAATEDEDPRVSEQALILAEPRMGEDRIIGMVLGLSSLDETRLNRSSQLLLRNRDSHWSFQRNLTSSFSPTERSTFLPNSPDSWARHSFVLAAGNRSASILGGHLKAFWTNKVPLTEERLATYADASRLVRRDQLHDVISPLIELPANLNLSDAHSTQRVQFAVLHGLAEGLSRQSTSLPQEIDRLQIRRIANAIAATVRQAEKTATRQDVEIELRNAAIDFLADVPQGVGVVSKLAEHEPSQPVRLRAIMAFSRSTDAKTWQTLLARFPYEPPAIRRALVDATLARAERTMLLLNDIAARRIKPAELDQAHINRLLNHPDAAIRERARKLLADAIPADRQKVLAEYQVVLKIPSEAKRGLEVFKKNCAACHRVGGVGVDVAPDISDSRVKTAEQLLTDILQPNRAIDGNYISYTLLTKDGRSLVGVIASETATGVTLKQQEGKSVTLLRSEIEQMQSNGISLMPEGLEKEINHQQMADVISYVKNWRYLDGKTPLGR